MTHFLQTTTQEENFGKFVPVKEVWKNIRGFEKRYQISNRGRIKSASGILRKTNPDKDGYPRVDLKQNGYRKNVRVHNLLAEHFIRKSSKYGIVNHIDADKSNYRLKNLERVTPSENVRHGNMVKAHKRKSKRGKIISVKAHIRK